MIVPLSKDNQNLLSMLVQWQCGLPPTYKQLCAGNHIDWLSDLHEFRKENKAILTDKVPLLCKVRVGGNVKSITQVFKYNLCTECKQTTRNWGYEDVIVITKYI